MNFGREEHIFFDTLNFVQELLHLPLLNHRDCFNPVDLFVGEDLIGNGRKKQDTSHDNEGQEDHFWSPLRRRVVIGFVVAIADCGNCGCDQIPGLPVNDELILGGELDGFFPAIPAFKLSNQNPQAGKVVDHEHKLEPSKEP